MSYRSFKILTVQLSCSGNLTADDAGLVKSTMEMVPPQTTVRATKFLIYLMVSEKKLNAPETQKFVKTIQY